MSLVQINKDIDSFLENSKSSFCIDSSTSDIFCDKPIQAAFSKPRDSKITNYTNDSSEPSIPVMSLIASEEDKISELLAKVVTISEIHQPDDNTLAERILSDSDEPFHINFDITDSEFKIDFSLIPDDSRCILIANRNFSGI